MRLRVTSFAVENKKHVKKSENNKKYRKTIRISHAGFSTLITVTQ